MNQSSLFQEKAKSRQWVNQCFQSSSLFHQEESKRRQELQSSLQELQQEESKREKERAWRKRLRLQLHQKDQSSLQELQQEEPKRRLPQSLCCASYVMIFLISRMQAS